MARSYRFGTVEVRPSERQLLVEGKPAPMGARAFDVLLALIDHRDRVLTKDELLDMCWPGLVVEENNLQVQVSSLRKVLGAQSVATIPGRGYRFTLEPIVDESAASSPLPERRHNLPSQLTSFVGREAEIADVREALEVSRLVTLTSVGGTGKTRLSLQVAAQLADSFRDGAWFVELAPIAEGNRVPHAVAAALGVKEEPGRPIVEALARFAREREMLIVLDNCEHVLQACAELAKRLLVGSERVRILASSREQLHVAGEAIFPVGALAEPEAMRLFAERAAAVRPEFEIDAGNRAHVAQICKRLDGLPLAIELAAARMRAMSVESLAGRLDDCFRVLTGGDHTALPRQQTLRASIDWSSATGSPSRRSRARAPPTAARRAAPRSSSPGSSHASWGATRRRAVTWRRASRSHATAATPSASRSRCSRWAPRAWARATWTPRAGTSRKRSSSRARAARSAKSPPPSTCSPSCTASRDRSTRPSGSSRR